MKYAGVTEKPTVYYKGKRKIDQEHAIDLNIQTVLPLSLSLELKVHLKEHKKIENQGLSFVNA